MECSSIALTCCSCWSSSWKLLVWKPPHYVNGGFRGWGLSLYYEDTTFSRSLIVHTKSWNELQAPGSTWNQQRTYTKHNKFIEYYIIIVQQSIKLASIKLAKLLSQRTLFQMFAGVENPALVAFNKKSAITFNEIKPRTEIIKQRWKFTLIENFAPKVFEMRY